MAARTTMANLITKVRQMINDPSGPSEQFADNDIQDRLDVGRDDIRYEPEKIAPSIVNLGSSAQSAVTIFADYYSKYQYWEDDVVLQGQGSTGLPWIVLTPTLSEPTVGHWQFEGTTLGYVYSSGTVPGQLPPVFATGKVYDIYQAAADLLEFWAASLTDTFNFSADGKSFQRNQRFTSKMKLAAIYRTRAKVRTSAMVRGDANPELGTRRMRLLDEGDSIQGS